MKNKLLKISITLSSFLLLPLVTNAQVIFISPAEQACSGDGLGFIFCNIHRLLNSAVPILISLGVLYLVWGIVRYVIADDNEAKKAGRDRVVYGIIGLAVIVGIWGLVSLVVNTFYLGGQFAPELQSIGVEGNSCELGSNPTLANLLGYATCFINDSLIPLMFALAVAYFIWGVVQFINGADEETKRTQGRQHMIWGIIALAVMLSVWGLVAVLGNTFGGLVDTSVLPQVKP